MMGKEFDKSYTWVIKNFSSLKSEEIYSNQFVNGGCKWNFTVYPKGYTLLSNTMILYFGVADYMSLPSGWRRHAKISLTIVNQLHKKLSQRKETQQWFHENYTRWRFDFPFPLDVLHAKDGGFVVNGELMVVAEVKVLEVIGNLDVTVETSAVMEHVDVNGFHVPSLEVESVKRLFAKYPDIASNFCPENPYLKTPYMSLLLGVTKTLSQSPLEVSKSDLKDAFAAVISLKVAGFKLDWLEKKLEEAEERVVAAEIWLRMRKIDEKLKDLKDQEALLEKEKANILAASVTLKVDDVF